MNLKKIEALAEEAGVSPVEIIYAMRHPAAWDGVFPHSPAFDLRSLSTEARGELHEKLEQIRVGLMPKVKEGDLEAASLATALAMRQAVLR